MLKQILKQTARLSIILVLLFGLGVQVMPTAAADPVEIIVNSNGDQGKDGTADLHVCETSNGNGICTLRAAILTAYFSTPGTLITFSIPRGSTVPSLPTVITIGSQLPRIVVAGTTIQGPNLAAGTLDNSAIVLDGNQGGYDGIEIRANNCAVKNLTISNFSGFGKYGILVYGTADPLITGTLITGNKIGDFRQPLELLAKPNYGGIYLLNAGSSFIGGSTTAERNIISGNTEVGILVEGGGPNVIQGNYIGVKSDGT